MKPSEELVKKLLQSLNYIDVIPTSRLKGAPYALIRSNIDEKISNGFWQDGLNLIQVSVDDILDIRFKNLGPLYLYTTEKFVFEFLIKKLPEIKENPDNNKFNLISQTIQEFFKTLKVYTYFCYLKVGNFKTSKLYDFNSFKIFPNNNEYLERMLEVPDVPKKLLMDHFKKEANLYQSILELKILAVDGEYAKNKSIHDVKDIFNVLRIFGAKGIFYEGDQDFQSQYVSIINNDTKAVARFEEIVNSSKLGPPFNLDEFDSKNPLLTKKLAIIFDKKNSSTFHKKILYSLIWLGESVNEPNFSHQLLKMIISMESLLLDSKDRGTKSHLLEERAAFLLGKNYETRSMIAETIKGAYQFRNDIVHNGEKTPVPFRLIKLLLSFNYQLIMKFLTTDKYTNIEEVKKEVRNRKYKSG
jgi:hypothetical protein